MLTETLRALSGQNSRLLPALQFLFGNAAQPASFQDLPIQPVLASHRNVVNDKPFVLPKERFGGSEDVALVPFIRSVVDQTLCAYAHTSSYLLEYVGNTPISPYGSIALSVGRWGYVDWDYIRDLDWRIFLPPQIGHLSGFKTHLQMTLTSELGKYRLYPLLCGRDERGLPQVQLREIRTANIHGFHLFLIAMKPGFVRGNLHRDGGYSPHFAYFPESSLDAHLETANMRWSDVIQQQREDYVDMFNQLSFNIFGENDGESRKLKTRGWYLRKAFKWYATLARVRGLAGLEEDLLYQYERFQGSEEELAHLARRRYYSQMAPSRMRLDELDRDLARVASIAYAQARNPDHPFEGQQASGDGPEIVLLEAVPEDFAAPACKLLEQNGVALPNQLHHLSFAARIRFADNLSAPCRVHLQDGNDVILIPAGWSMVLGDSYICQVMKKIEEENRPLVQQDVRQALVMFLACLLHQVIVERS